MITSLAGKPVSGESATSSEDTATGEPEVQSLLCISYYIPLALLMQECSMPFPMKCLTL